MDDGSFWLHWILVSKGKTQHQKDNMQIAKSLSARFFAKYSSFYNW